MESTNIMFRSARFAYDIRMNFNFNVDVSVELAWISFPPFSGYTKIIILNEFLETAHLECWEEFSLILQ